MTYGEQVDLVKEALLDITEGGQEGRIVSHGELAMAYMKRHPTFLRRLKTVNEFREFFLLEPSEGPSRPRSKYRQETSLALMAMEEESSIGYVFVDPETGEPETDPTPPLDYRNRRYFPIVEAEATAAPGEQEPPMFRPARVLHDPSGPYVM